MLLLIRDEIMVDADGSYSVSAIFLRIRKLVELTLFDFDLNTQPVVTGENVSHSDVMDMVGTYGSNGIGPVKYLALVWGVVLGPS